MSHRVRRLNELFRRELARLLLTEVKDPRLTDVTVTEVRTSRDLSYATVYVQIDGDAEEALEGLEQANGFLRGVLGRELHIRKVPEFRFVLDETLAHASRIEELLRRARAGDAGDGEG